MGRKIVEIGPEESGEDPLTLGVQYAARAVLDRMNDADEWDLPPMLFVVGHGPMVEHDDLPARIRDTAEPAPEGTLGMQMVILPLDVPDEVWAMAEAHKVLDLLAGRIEEQGPGPMPDPEVRILAAMFVSEVWMLHRDMDTDVDAEKWAAEHAGMELSEHADRIEARIAHAVDTMGRHVAMSWERGAAEPFQHESGLRIEGRIPDAVSRIAAALIDDVDDELAHFQG